MCSFLFLITVAVLHLVSANWESTISRYEANHPPFPLVVRLGMDIHRFREINSKGGDSFDVQLTFRQSWRESKLQHAQDKGHRVERHQIWTPDTFFINELEGHAHRLLRDNSLTFVKPRGEIILSQRLSLKLSCPIKLHAFPFDKQECDISIGSYGYTKDQIEYAFEHHNPIHFREMSPLYKFNMRSYNLTNCTSTTSTGIYSCVKVTFTFDRLWTPYVLQVFLPMTLLVALSWLTFWLRDIHVRVTILMFLLLLAVAIAADTNEHLPKTSYLKLIDIFTGVCLTFIFAALVEFVIVQRKSQEIEDNCEYDEKLDSSCRIFFPSAYLLFLITYSILAMVY